MSEPTCRACIGASLPHTCESNPMTNEVEPTAADKLRPCPFCGIEDTDYDQMYLDADRPGWRVECLNCGAFGATACSTKEATKAWNGQLRQDREAELEGLLREARNYINVRAGVDCEANTLHTKIVGALK